MPQNRTTIISLAYSSERKERTTNTSDWMDWTGQEYSWESVEKENSCFYKKNKKEFEVPTYGQYTAHASIMPKFKHHFLATHVSPPCTLGNLAAPAEKICEAFVLRLL
jgi:hypothetical protein